VRPVTLIVDGYGSPLTAPTSLIVIGVVFENTAEVVSAIGLF